MAYRSNPDWGWEEPMASGIVGLCLMVAILLIALILTITIMLTTELIRIYQEHGRVGSRIGRVLWIALASFGLLLLVALLLATNPATLPLGAYLAAWGFLVFIIVVEVAAHRAQPEPVLEPDLSLPDVLGAWSPAPVGSNGWYAEDRAS